VHRSAIAEPPSVVVVTAPVSTRQAIPVALLVRLVLRCARPPAHSTSQSTAQEVSGGIHDVDANTDVEVTSTHRCLLHQAPFAWAAVDGRPQRVLATHTVASK
jgi:hypothetical protein